MTQPAAVASVSAFPATVRTLPPEEYEKLLAIEGPLHGLPAIPDPDHTRIVVAEADGEIVAYWVLFTAVHAEPLWIRPDHRKRAVWQGLLSQIERELVANQVQSVFAMVGDADLGSMTPLVEKAGFEKVPGVLYARHLLEAE